MEKLFFNMGSKSSISEFAIVVSWAKIPKKIGIYRRTLPADLLIIVIPVLKIVSRPQSVLTTMIRIRPNFGPEASLGCILYELRMYCTFSALGALFTQLFSLYLFDWCQTRVRLLDWMMEPEEG